MMVLFVFILIMGCLINYGFFSSEGFKDLKQEMVIKFTMAGYSDSTRSTSLACTLFFSFVLFLWPIALTYLCIRKFDIRVEG